MKRTPNRFDKQNTVTRSCARKLYWKWLMQLKCIVTRCTFKRTPSRSGVFRRQVSFGCSEEIPEEEGRPIFQEVFGVICDLWVRQSKQAVYNKRHHQRPNTYINQNASRSTGYIFCYRPTKMTLCFIRIWRCVITLAEVMEWYEVNDIVFVS